MSEQRRENVNQAAFLCGASWRLTGSWLAKHWQEFLFDGIDDYVLVPPDPRLNVGAQGSIVLWMRADPTNLMDTCCQGLVTTDYFGVEIGSAPAGVVFYVNTGGGWVHMSDTDACSQCAGGFPVSAGAWHHIVGTYDGTQLQLYVDGVAAGNTRFHTGTILPMLPGSFLAIGSGDGRRCCGIEPRLFPRQHRRGRNL